LADRTGTNGNIAADPLFANAAGGNFRLKSQGGRWNGLKWVLDLVSSPCLDSGDPASDFALEPAPNGGRINMGYDGNTVAASKAVPPTVVAWGPKGTTVGVTANINITFSEAMIRPSAQGAMFINGVKVSTSSTFGGTFTWLAKKMVFNPTNDLLPGTTYRIVIGKAARSRAGGCMTKGFSYEFTTKGAPPAAVTLAAAPTAFGAQITLSLASSADVTVSIRNLAGREVATLTPGRLEAGVQSLLWNGKSKTGTQVPSGTYLLQVSANTADGSSAQALTSLPIR
jgi:hypothetical protein